MSVDIYEKISSKAYEVCGEVPAVVKKPPILRKMVSELSDEELATVGQVRVEYEKAQKEWRQYWDVRRKREGELIGEFWDDLCEHFDVPSDHPFIGRLMSFAWDNGHSGGLLDVAHYFGVLIDLWYVACNCGMQQEIGEQD